MWSKSAPIKEGWYFVQYTDKSPTNSGTIVTIRQYTPGDSYTGVAFWGDRIVLPAPHRTMAECFLAQHYNSKDVSGVNSKFWPFTVENDVEGNPCKLLFEDGTSVISGEGKPFFPKWVKN